MGGRTTGLYNLYLSSRISHYKPPSLSFFPQLSSGNVGRVVDEKYRCGITSDTSALKDVSAHLTSSDLFPVASSDTLFKVKFIFTSTRLQIRWLNIQELLRLWDHPDHIISSLEVRHRTLLWESNNVSFANLGYVIALLVVTSYGGGE